MYPLIRQHPRLPWPLLAIIAAALGAAGCSNNPYPREDWEAPVYYTTLGEDPKTLDPTIAYTVSDGEIVMNIYDTFLEYHHLKRDPVVLVPSMGAAMPIRVPSTFQESVIQKDKNGDPVHDSHGQPVVKSVTRHGEIWTFHIKPGIKFADDPCFPGGKGREVVGADFIYSFKRMADPTVGCPILTYVLPHVLGMQDFFDAQTGIAAASKKAGKHYICDLQTPVSGLQADKTDPYTFRIILRDPYPQLKYLMAMGFTAPIPHEAVEFYNYGTEYHDEFRKHPVGPGPYRLAEWTPKQRVVLERNPYYHTETYPTEGAPGDREKGLLVDAGKALPLLPKVVFTIIKENIPGWNLFLQGYMDGWGVPKESFDKVVTRQGALSPEMRAKGITLQKDVGMDVSYFAFNMEDAQLGGYTPQRRKLRQAISLAFDTQEYLDLLTNGQGKPAQGALPPGIFGYDPNYRNPYRQTNVEKAKALLAEAGYPGGIDPATGRPLEINYDTGSASAAGRYQTGLVIRQLERLGIKVNERGTLYNVFQDRVNSGQFQFTSWGWVADYPDPENFYLLFYGPNKGPGPNTSRYNNPAFDRLFEKMATMEDSPERLKLIAQMRMMLQEDCPWIFNDHSEALLLRYDWVKNSKPHPVALNNLKYIRIDAAERAQKRAAWNKPRYDVVAAIFGVLVLISLPAVIRGWKKHSVTVRASRKTLIGANLPERND